MVAMYESYRTALNAYPGQAISPAQPAITAKTYASHASIHPSIPSSHPIHVLCAPILAAVHDD